MLNLYDLDQKAHDSANQRPFENNFGTLSKCREAQTTLS